MANKHDRNISDERIEDVTMYGEFISSFHNWVTLDRQKNIANYLEEVSEEISTDKNKSDKKRSN